MSIQIKKYPYQASSDCHKDHDDFKLYCPSRVDAKHEVRRFWNKNLDLDNQRVPQKVTVHTKNRGGLDKGWIYDGFLYTTNDPNLTADDLVALVNQEENKRRIQLEKAHALQAMREQLDSGRRRASIPQDVKVAIWQRDHGRCVQCSSNSDLEFDHIIPLAMGGSNTARNLQLLCATCNRRKGASLG